MDGRPTQSGETVIHALSRRPLSDTLDASVAVEIVPPSALACWRCSTATRGAAAAGW